MRRLRDIGRGLIDRARIARVGQLPTLHVQDDRAGAVRLGGERMVQRVGSALAVGPGQLQVVTGVIAHAMRHRDERNCRQDPDGEDHEATPDAEPRDRIEHTSHVQPFPLRQRALTCVGGAHPGGDRERSQEGNPPCFPYGFVTRSRRRAGSVSGSPACDTRLRGGVRPSSR